MVFLAHALESQSNDSVTPQDGKRNTLVLSLELHNNVLGLCAKRYSDSTLESSQDLLCILCPVLPAIEGFYKYAFPEK